MAFQDNSYGIILDAVLTDVGRRKMAQGKFKIAKFTLADDEVDYRLGNRASGSFKLDANPPILEAFATEQGSLNYTLNNFPRVDVMYIPQIKVNNLVNSSVTAHTDEMYYFAVNNETRRKLVDNIGESKVLLNNSYDKTKIFIESGIVPDSAFDIDPTKENKKLYLYNMDLYDKYYTVYMDTRFFDNLLNSPMDAMFENDENDKLYANFEPLQTSVRVSLSQLIDNYDAYRLSAADNNVRDMGSGIKGNSHSMFTGPRATIFALNLKCINEIVNDSSSSSDFRYSKFGETSYNLFSSSERYDFIDTSIYIQGLSSNSRLNIPVRVIRYSGSV